MDDKNFIYNDDNKEYVEKEAKIVLKFWEAVQWKI